VHKEAEQLVVCRLCTARWRCRFRDLGVEQKLINSIPPAAEFKFMVVRENEATAMTLLRHVDKSFPEYLHRLGSWHNHENNSTAGGVALITLRLMLTSSLPGAPSRKSEKALLQDVRHVEALGQ